ncbi:pyridoxal phosphate-dependent aminotransferase [Candidatus Sodalis endolongispinus]|uniref:Aminotransferase n=1 Tax=Candidatus Sodalis endolongispinus TaxID=2812662 RepID=A0ABS5Y8C1_9GAMM|nr:pyridoxal phosphate-dependent aminotransferase [Candidatus Sodalis endolongispinus]MBT9431182.1 pyridoxal phosphate-dependent aminotransferase [Candidatus Sodalis endolongispinus]
MSETPLQPGHPALAREAVRDLRFSAIRDVANAGIGRDDVLPFWFSDPDLPTPAFICAAAQAALAAGDTFYTPNLGEPALRKVLANALSQLHRPVSPSRVVVTSSGVSALMLTAQALYSPGDRVVVVTPVWPNLVEIPRILGAQVEEVALELRRDEQGIARWHLCLETLLNALTPLVINSPNNPSGWVMSAQQQAVILAHCRRHGIWIVSDEVYSRIVFDGPPEGCAPSFLDIADPNDRLVVINSFSKSWLMTGWRLGWVVAPPALMYELGKLIEYNSSCAPGFVQKAGLVAVNQGEAVRQETVARFQASRDYLYQRLGTLADIEVPLPAGAMYLFFRVRGLDDSLAFCKALVAEAGVGLAPGSAFGDAGEGCLRWCIASSIEKMEQGAERFSRFLHRSPLRR